MSTSRDVGAGILCRQIHDAHGYLSSPGGHLRAAPCLSCTLLRKNISHVRSDVVASKAICSTRLVGSSSTASLRQGDFPRRRRGSSFSSSLQESRTATSQECATVTSRRAAPTQPWLLGVSSGGGGRGKLALTCPLAAGEHIAGRITATRGEDLRLWLLQERPEAVSAQVDSRDPCLHRSRGAPT